MNFDWWFWAAQICGLAALAIKIVSFRGKSYRRLLRRQVVSSAVNAAQYLFLGAWAGAIKSLMGAIRNLVFTRYSKQRPPVFWPALFSVAMTVFTVAVYQGPISLLPLLTFVAYTLGIWSQDTRWVRVTEIFGCLLFIVYNICVGAYAGLLATLAELTGVIVVSVWPSVPKAAKPKTKRKRK